MDILNWFRSWFARPRKGERVRFYDVEFQRVVEIPPAELRPGCVRANIQGIEGTVWVAADQLQTGPIRHEPFAEDIRSTIREIQAAFAEHRDISCDDWEDGFRRDAHPEREIALFSYTADVYRLFAQDETDADRRAEIYRLLAGKTRRPARQAGEGWSESG